MLKDIILLMPLKLYILVSLTPISVIAVLCVCVCAWGRGVALLKSSNYRSFKIGLPESLQAASMTPLASIYLKP